jgi:NitT/TauT family transport system permease protein
MSSPSEAPHGAGGDHIRRDFIRVLADIAGAPVVAVPLTPWQRLHNSAVARNIFIVAALALAWEAYATWLGNPLLFPTLSATLAALWNGVAGGEHEILVRSGVSMAVLLVGYGAGVALAFAFAVLAFMSRLGTDLLETLTAMFNPLPAIALLPLALLWFGLGNASIVFVLVHSVVWAVALNAHAGFRAVSETTRMVGRNYGLGNVALVLKILLPAAFPSILAGLKIGWAFAWRTLIAAELVFGATSGSGGLGWYIYENKNQIEIPNVFAGLLTVILIGLAVENLVFGIVERRTVRRWGMQI